MHDKDADSGSGVSIPDDSDLEELRRLDRGVLETQFDALVSALGAARDANDAQQCMLLGLQSHQIELEIQGRDLRETQKALELSRNHYVRLFDEAPVGYVVFDSDGRIRSLNRTASLLIDRPSRDLDGVSFLDFLPDAERADFMMHLAQVFEESDVAHHLCDLVLHLSHSGGVRVVRLCSVRRDGLVGPECLTVLLDITAEYQAEREREVSDHLRQAVLDALPSQIAVLNREGSIIAVNRAWRELAEETGVSGNLGDAIGVGGSGGERLDPTGRWRTASEASRGIWQVLRRERSDFSLEYASHTDRRKRWFLMRAVALDGVRDGAVVAYVDVTERRLAEEEVRRARDALAQVARLNAVGILASSLIHELLQPLSSASFYCSAAGQLAQGPAADPSRLVDVIGRIDGQIKRAGDIMERLRMFLRGRKMHKVAVSLDQVVKRAFALVQWFATDHKVTLGHEIPEGLPELMLDPVQIEQVLVNLICNAIQVMEAAESSRREVSVEVIPWDREILLVVKDTGPGIPRGRHESVFDIFESTSDASLGLGLAISRSIAEAHGGRLWADPGATEGAEFHLTLPLSLADPMSQSLVRFE